MRSAAAGTAVGVPICQLQPRFCQIVVTPIGRIVSIRMHKRDGTLLGSQTHWLIVLRTAAAVSLGGDAGTCIHPAQEEVHCIAGGRHTEGQGSGRQLKTLTGPWQETCGHTLLFAPAAVCTALSLSCNAAPICQTDVNAPTQTIVFGVGDVNRGTTAQALALAWHKLQHHGQLISRDVYQLEMQRTLTHN